MLEETESVVESMVGNGDGTAEKELPKHDGVRMKAGNVEMAVNLFCGFEAVHTSYLLHPPLVSNNT